MTIVIHMGVFSKNKMWNLVNIQSLQTNDRKPHKKKLKCLRIDCGGSLCHNLLPITVTSKAFEGNWFSHGLLNIMEYQKGKIGHCLNMQEVWC
jgi:hypothetical protein